MIKHVVCFKLKDPAMIGQWREQSASLAEIDTVRRFEASLLLKQDAYHCALYMEFEDRAGLRRYLDHEIHQRYLREVLPPLLADKLVLDLLSE